MGYGSADAERSLHDDVERLTRERDEWRRKAKEKQELFDDIHKDYVRVCHVNEAHALQNRELRKALELIDRGSFRWHDLIQKALALTPTQAEKIVAAMEEFIKAIETELPRGKYTKLMNEKLTALDAARKGE